MLDNSPVRRAISLAVITSYLTLLSAPTAAAVKQEIFARPKPLTEHSVSESELSRMREAVRRQALEARLRPAGSEGVVDKIKGLFGDSVAVKSEKALVASLLQSRARLQQEAAEQDKAMAATRADLVKKNLPATILARHDEAVKTIVARRAELMKDLTLLDTADKSGEEAERRSKLDAVSKKIEQWGGESAVKTDYKHLPWGTPDSKVRAPRESKTAYLMNLEMFGIKPLQVAGPVPAGTVLPVLPNLGAAVQPADTAENEDVQLTQAIRDQAAALGHNPARIYKWVYDNIEFIPSYGSIQGADYTLQTKRGNSFDTSSLLIGLLRASNIPARYVYGTVEIPMDKVMNWVGGVTSPDAALSLLGQGGIPSIGLTSAGQFKAVRLEHVWVEAYVDFVPSRGAKQKQSDTWVPLDAAFKQYTYTQPMNLQQAVPFDAQALVNQVQQGATIDEANGYVQNLNQSSIETALTNYQGQVKAYLEQQRPNATVADLLGSKVIQPYPSQMLAGTLQVKHVAVAGDFQTLPSTMRHYFNYTVYADAQSRDLGSPIIDQHFSLPFLAGKFLALSFKPATAADEATISSYLPQPHADGSPIDPSQLPQSLPGYLINLTPELTINGEVIANTSISMAMGSEIFTRSSITSPNSNASNASTENSILVGEYQAVGLSGQGVSVSAIQRLAADLDAIKHQLDSGSDSFISKHQAVGILMQANIYSYFLSVEMQDRYAARSADVVNYRQPSYGFFGSTLKAVLSFGVPSKVGVKGITIDIDKMTGTLIEKSNDKRKERAFQVALGVRASANEHLVPERFLSAQNQSASGISAIKALKFAVQQGQRIYTITRSNAAHIVPDLGVDGVVKDEIYDATDAGYSVTVSQNNVTSGGWVGVGYIISDLVTGAAAYKISGGENGGFLGFIGDNANSFGAALGVVSVLTAIGLASPAGIALSVLVAAFVVNLMLSVMLLFVSDLQLIEGGCPDPMRMMNAAFNLASFMAGFFFGGAGEATILAVMGWVYTSFVPAMANACRLFGG